MPTYQCTLCLKDFERLKSQAEKSLKFGRRLFCSMKCFRVAQTKYADKTPQERQQLYLATAKGKDYG